MRFAIAALSSSSAHPRSAAARSVLVLFRRKLPVLKPVPALDVLLRLFLGGDLTAFLIAPAGPCRFPTGSLSSNAVLHLGPGEATRPETCSNVGDI